MNASSSQDLAADTALLFHCSGSSARQWTPIAAALADVIDPIALDLTGYGPDAVAWPAGKPCSLDDEADRLEHWLRDAPPVHLIGHSFGATVAMQLALRRPACVRSLTLYEPVRFALLFGDPQTRPVGDAIVEIGGQIGHAVLSGNCAAAAETFIDYWSGTGTWAAMTPRHQAGAAARMPKVHAEFGALFGDPVPLAAYRALTMPVLLLVGTQTPAPPREVARLLASALPHVTCESLPGLGHMGPVTNPPLVASRMRAFLTAQTLPDAPASAAATLALRPSQNREARSKAVSEPWRSGEDRAATPSPAAR